MSKIDWREAIKKHGRLNWEFEAQLDSDCIISCHYCGQCDNFHSDYELENEIEVEREETNPETGEVETVIEIETEIECVDWCVYHGEEVCGDDEACVNYECSYGDDSSDDYEYVRENVMHRLNSGEPWNENALVNSVHSDGSLTCGGIEVTTTRQPWNLDILLERLTEINSAMCDEGAYCDEDCGAHTHVNLCYNNISRSKKEKAVRLKLRHENRYFDKQEFSDEALPKGIARNIYNLTRKFASAIAWITAAQWGRNANYRKATGGESGEILADEKNMKQAVEKNSRYNSRYSMISFQRARFDDIGNMPIVHIEWRIPDGHLVPIVHVCTGGMLLAIMLKAANLYYSKGSHTCRMSAKEASQELKDYHSMMGIRPNEEDRKVLINSSLYFVEYLREELDELDGRLYPLLKDLARKPLAECSGQTFRGRELEALAVRQ